MEGFLARAEILGRAGHQPPLRQTTDGRFVTNITVYTNFVQNRADRRVVWWMMEAPASVSEERKRVLERMRAAEPAFWSLYR